MGKAVDEHAGTAAPSGLDPGSPEALAVIKRLEAISPRPPEDRAGVADRIKAFTDRRVGRYWTLVGIVNDWPPTQTPDGIIDAWKWYACALCAHA